MSKKIIEWILQRKEGEQFLAASLLSVIFLVGVVYGTTKFWVSRDNEKDKTIIELRERLEKKDQLFLQYIMHENDEKQIRINQVDSLTMVTKELQKNSGH